MTSQDNCAKDTVLKNELYSYLIQRITDYSVDKNGIHIPDIEEFKDVCIISRNLKTDSIIQDKSLIGVYETNFACFDCGTTTEIYFQHKDKIEFIDLTGKKFKYEKVLKQVDNFFKRYPKSFTNIDKVTILKNVLNILEFKLKHD